MADTREETVVSPQMFGLMNINLVPEMEESRGVGKKTNQGRNLARRGDLAGGSGFIDPLDWELHLQTVAQQKKNQEEEAVRQRRRQIEHCKSKAGIQMQIHSYQKAAGLYSKVLELEGKDIEALLFRAECYYEIKRFEDAIKDTKAAILLDGKIAKAYGIQGDCQFQLAEFEEALISYHRARRLRPGVRQYSDGVNRVESVINAAIGETSHARLNLTGDLSYFDQFSQQTKENTSYIRATRPITREGHSASSTKSSARRRDIKQAKTIKQLLEELYGDYSYLEQLKLEEDQILEKLESRESRSRQKRAPREPGTNEKWRKTSEFVRDKVDREIAYLTARSEFYRHLKSPRPQPQNESESGGFSRGSSVMSVTSPEELLEMIEEIEADQAGGLFAQSLKKCEKALGFIEGQTYLELPDRDQFEATLYSLKGNAYFEQEKYSKALHSYEEDLSIARACKNLEEAEARALDNIGRVYAKMGQFSKAIHIFEERVGKAKTSLELTWLHHELGRCYFEIKDTEKALHHAENSLEAAQDAGDRAWQLNALVLKAQALEEQRRYDDALDVFHTALDVACKDKDTQAQMAIENAIDHDKQKTQKLNGENTDDPDGEASRMKESIQQSNEEQAEEDRKEAREIRDMIRTDNKKNNDKETEETQQSTEKEDEDVTDEAQEIRDMIKSENERDREHNNGEETSEKSPKWNKESNDEVDNEKASSSEESKGSEVSQKQEEKDFRDTILKSNAEEEQKVTEDIKSSIKESNKKTAKKGSGQKASGGIKGSSKQKQGGQKKASAKPKGGASKGKDDKKETIKKPALDGKSKNVKGQKGKEDKHDETSKDETKDHTKEDTDTTEDTKVDEKGDSHDEPKPGGKNTHEVAMNASDVRDMILESNKESSEKGDGKQKQEKDEFYD